MGQSIKKVKQSSFVLFHSREYSILELDRGVRRQLRKDLKRAGNVHGLYFLYKTKGKGGARYRTLYYVGKSRPHILKRILTHQKNRHKGNWDSFSVMTVKPKYVKLVEAIIISCARPKGNSRNEKIRAMTTGQKYFLAH